MINLTYQQELIRLGLLDPPADSVWGEQSEFALSDFCDCSGIPRSTDSDKIIELLKATPSTIKLGNDFASKVIKHMRSQQYFVAVSTQNETRYNIVYVEGCDPDGELNNDAFNEFNDASLLIEIVGGVPKIIFAAEGTTEPGRYYTNNPLNPGGAFRIAFGQYKAWRLGYHGTRRPYEALVQCGNVTGYRDFNKDGLRTGDKIVTGSDFGVNQHAGYDFPENNVGEASAGCLVRRTWDDHRTFMKLVKRDCRFLVNSSYTFMTAVIPGDKI